ncbi:ABC transporter permease [Pseudarthrobacter sp. J1738]|uniref:ABC transporter permease n=1 Tax=Pseudarthrobacter sp. J1738 TaxID=3420446 RepID=UPI003D27A6A1
MPRPLRLFKYHAYSMWNWRSSYLGRFIEPIAYFAFLIAGLNSVMQSSTGINYVQFALSGMICFLAFRSATSTVSDVANDRKWGVFAIYTLQGGSTAGYLFSVVLFSMAVFIVQFLLLWGVSLLAFGWQISLDQLALQGLVGMLIVLGWNGCGAAIGARIQSYSVRDMIVVLTSLPVILSAPLFYPLDGAPSYLRAISSVNPLTYQVQWLRNPDLTNIGWAAGWAVAGLIVGGFMLASAERVSRER